MKSSDTTSMVSVMKKALPILKHTSKSLNNNVKLSEYDK
jgi:hypothetical protein